MMTLILMIGGFMLELGLFFCLLGSMGVYIFKSADLPSELKERSERLEAENSQLRANKKLQISLTPLESRKSKKLNKVEQNVQNKIEEIVAIKNNELLQSTLVENEKINQLIQEKKLIETKIELTKKEIAQLNYEIRINTEKNIEIQKKISIKELTLKSLEEKLTKLA